MTRPRCIVCRTALAVDNDSAWTCRCLARDHPELVTLRGGRIQFCETCYVTLHDLPSWARQMYVNAPPAEREGVVTLAALART